MQFQLGLIILTKTKDNNPYCELFGHGDKTLSTDVTIDSMQVSVPAEDVSQ
jgi:hypothetical protein